MIKQIKAEISPYLKDDEIIASPCAFETIFYYIELIKAAYKIKSYIRHDRSCDADFDESNTCTCGVTDLLNKLEKLKSNEINII